MDPSLLKPKKQKSDTESQSSHAATPTTSTPLLKSPSTGGLFMSRQELNKTPQSQSRKRQGSKSPAIPTPSPTQNQENTQTLHLVSKQKKKILKMCTFCENFLDKCFANFLTILSHVVLIEIGRAYNHQGVLNGDILRV